MRIPVLSKIQFLVRHLWDRLDYIRLLTEHVTRQTEHVTRQTEHVTGQIEHVTRQTEHVTGQIEHVTGQTEHVTRQIDALAESIDALITNNTLIFEALGRLIKNEAEYRATAKRIEDWLVAFDSYNGSIRNDIQLINVIKLNIDRLLSFAKDNNSDRHEPNTGLLALNPELCLLDHLHRFLPSNVLIDVGAHRGDFANFLLRCGYQVYGFEPNPETFAVLMDRLAGNPQFRGFELALSDRDGEAMFTIPKAKSATNSYGDTSLFCTLEGHPLPHNLAPDRSIKVTIRTISSLVAEGIIPPRAGVLKVDVEGHELDVLMGAERLQTDVIMAEFWSSDSEFATQGTRNDSLDLHLALRNKGYSHLITFNRVHGSTETMFHVNCPESIKNSWGNMVFFREGELFRHALQWCDASLSRVRFGSPPR
jgi:FkbM family methyltransferase